MIECELLSALTVLTKMDDKSKQTYTSDTVNALNTILKVRRAGVGLVLLSDVLVFLSQSNISVLPLISGVVSVMLKKSFGVYNS